MKNHKQINERMRSILVDWLVQVHEKFRLLQETLYLTVAFVDRYLDVSNVLLSIYPNHSRVLARHLDIL